MKYIHLILNNLPTYVIGDIHGDLNMLRLGINDNAILSNCNLIVAGDIGLGFRPLKKHREEYNKLDEYLFKKNIHLYMIRGNHDNPQYFIEHLIDTDNIKLIEDYTILTINNTNILCVGGGISIDRTYRMETYNNNLLFYQSAYEGRLSDAEILAKVQELYWKDEIPIYNEEALDEIKNDNINIDYIISHTSPKFAFKSDNKGIEYWLIKDMQLKDDLETERNTISYIYNKVLKDKHPLKEWIYGHFHEHHEEIINNITFTALLHTDYKCDIKSINIV